MAGEKKGKTYESLVAMALQQIVSTNLAFSEQTLYWNETPPGMSIEPDFVIGSEISNPDYVVMVTHGGSSKESNRKYWRSLAELYEAKINVSTSPKVFSIIFDSLIKKDVKKLEYATFDGCYLAEDFEEGEYLLSWVESNCESLPADQNLKLDIIKKKCEKNRELTQAIRKLTENLIHVLESKRSDLDAIWDMEKRRHKNDNQNFQRFFISRGLNKLLIFEDIDIGLALYRGNRLKKDCIPDYAYQLGLAGKSLKGAIPLDEEILGMVSCFSDEEIKNILACAPTERISSWLTSLRNLPHINLMGQFVLEHLDDICNPKTLHNYLVKLHSDENELIDQTKVPENWPPKRVWLLETLVEIIKASTGKSTGYGYSLLAKEVVDLGYGTAKDLTDAGQFGGGFGLSAWLVRNEKSPFRADLIEGIAVVISMRMASLSRITVEKLLDYIPELQIKSTLNKFMTKGFEPIKSIIETSFDNIELVSCESCFSSAAGLKARVGSTRVVKIKDHIVKWQSVTKSGRDHKKKELLSRIFAMRYIWNQNLKTFQEREGIKSYVLIVDGDWRKSDLDILCKAGWDKIFYPNQLNELKEYLLN